MTKEFIAIDVQPRGNSRRRGRFDPIDHKAPRTWTCFCTALSALSTHTHIARLRCRLQRVEETKTNDVARAGIAH